MVSVFTTISLKCHSFNLTSIYDALLMYVGGLEPCAEKGKHSFWSSETCPRVRECRLKFLYSKPVEGNCGPSDKVRSITLQRRISHSVLVIKKGG